MKAKEIICDVVVVGAGVSGLAAAVSASERGAKTVLLEQNNFLGGAVIAGMHRYLCGLYGKTVSRTINAGLARNLSSCLRKSSIRNRPQRLGKVYVLAFRNKDMKACLHTLVKNRKNLKVFLNSRACSVRQKRGSIQGVRAKAKGRIFTILPKVVIDASGEGAVIKLSKARYRMASYSKRQLSGFSFRLKGLKNANELLSIKVPYYIKFAVYTPLDSHGECLIRLNIPAGRDVVNIRKKAQKVCGCLRKVLPEFKDAYIVEFSPYIIKREGIRLCGEYTLTASDVLQGRRFKDGVVKNCWPIEIWDQKKGPYYKYINSGGYYEIPLRCLKSKNVKNLLVCGRCISVTHEALGSTRAAGTCIALGEQAGIAAVKLNEEYR
ncbi:MAG: FAD-dependent oxidoreductase [Candidatus Omnitrophica bacterium]|nr:FAD-dependent oxidoreductase [Candidatus Omnitrophota bacterium]